MCFSVGSVAPQCPECPQCPACDPDPASPPSNLADPLDCSSYVLCVGGCGIRMKVTAYS